MDGILVVVCRGVESRWEFRCKSWDVLISSILIIVCRGID